MRAFRPDVIFNTANRGFINPPAPQATFIHDSHLFYPSRQFGEAAPLDRMIFWYHRRHLRRSVRATQMLFCQTDIAQRRLKETYGLRYSPEIIPNQLADLGDIESTEMPTLSHPGALDGQFKLFVPTRYYAHKNLEVIPRLFDRYRDHMKDITVILTLSADQHRRAARLLRQIKRVSSDINLLAVGNLNRDELYSFYRYSDALFLPTFLESFSLTYLEAMRLERPIITSNMDFAHNICGDAAVYVDPYDTSSVLEGIMAVKNSADLREKLTKAGKGRLTLKKRSWDDIGKTVIKVLEDLAREAGRLDRHSSAEVRS
jgi:glycosyltransferase involved in cell wall biosynthesis